MSRLSLHEFLRAGLGGVIAMRVGRRPRVESASLLAFFLTASVMLVIADEGQSPRLRRATVAAGQASRALHLTTDPEAAVLPFGAKLGLEYAGCARVIVGPRCELGEADTLTLWMPSSFRDYQLMLDGESATASEQVVAGGYRAQLEPLGAQELRLERAGRVWFRLSLAPAQVPRAWVEATAAKDRADYPLALALADDLERAGSRVDALLARGVRGRVELRLGHFDRASELLEQSAEGLFAAGQLSEATRDAFARFFLLLHRQFKTEEAIAWLERWKPRAELYPLGRALISTHQGMIDAAFGNLSSALYHYGVAERSYERLGQETEHRALQEQRIGTLSDLGRIEEAFAEHARLMPPLEHETACSKADRYILHSWLAMLDVDEGRARGASLVPSLLDQASGWQQRCGDPEQLILSLVNRGLWALREGDPAEKRAVEDELSGLSPSHVPYSAAWVAELRGRLALAAGRHRSARAEFEREALIGRSSAQPDALLRSSLGLADVDREQGKIRSSVEHLRAAAATLQEAQRFAPFGALAHTQYAARKRAMLDLVRALVDQGRDDEAYQVALAAYRSALALQARSRKLEVDSATLARHTKLIADYRRRRQTLDREAESDWQVTSPQLLAREAQRRDELARLELLLGEASALIPESDVWQRTPRPDPGDFWLLVFPLQNAWLLFGTNGDRAKLARFTRSEAEANALDISVIHPLLAPFADEFRKAERIVVLPAGASRSWPFERWQLDGIPLGARRLAFGAALPRSSSTRHSSDNWHTAIVANPSEDLPHAALEGTLVERALGIPKERALFGREATASRMLGLLETTDFLHFAGHAGRNQEPGIPALLLGEGTALEAWELFGLTSVPSEVVLSACHSAETRPDTLDVGWGLAQVLLALGSESVVGPLGAVADEVALEAQQQLYARLSQGVSLREAFFGAEHALFEANSSAWGAFRLFVR